jgi:maternal embryonic leucine zipper kinase
LIVVFGVEHQRDFFRSSAMLYSALIGSYALVKTIGNGGFGKVKQAVHLLTGEHVAIKIIDKGKLGVMGCSCSSHSCDILFLQKDIARIPLEIQAMKQLRHQHICQLYQVIETEEHYFLVLQV